MPPSGDEPSGVLRNTTVPMYSTIAMITNGAGTEANMVGASVAPMGADRMMVGFVPAVKKSEDSSDHHRVEPSTKRLLTLCPVGAVYRVVAAWVDFAIETMLPVAGRFVESTT